MMIFLHFIFVMLICTATSQELQEKLKRHKRWNKSGYMDNNGGMNNAGNMANQGAPVGHTGDLSANFRGTAGVDYPDFKSIPTTNFRCDDQSYEGGLYADVETQCQVYHVCHEGRKDSFLCGKGTIFNQEILACDYWYSTDCDKAPSFYYINAQIGNSGPSWKPAAGNNEQSQPVNNYQAGNNYQPQPGNTNQPGSHRQPQPGNTNQPGAHRQPQPGNTCQPGAHGQPQPGNTYQPGAHGQPQPGNTYQSGVRGPSQPGNTNQAGTHGQPQPVNTYQPGVHGQPQPGNTYQTGNTGPNSYQPGSSGSNTFQPGNHGSSSYQPGSNNPNSYRPAVSGRDTFQPAPANTGSQVNQPHSSQGTSMNNNQPANDENCCCQKFSVKQPWSFPAFPKSK